MAKFIKIKDNEIINIDHIVLIVESKYHSRGELYTKIFLTKTPFPVEIDMTLDEVYELIKNSSEI